MAKTDLPTRSTTQDDRDPSERQRFHSYPLQSEAYIGQALPSTLRTWDMIALFIIILFFITNVPTAVAGGAAGLSLWIIGGICFFIPCAIATAQLGVMYPYEGSLYNWTHKAFGGFMSFFVGFCAWLPCSLLILATSDLVVSYIQALNQNWLVQPWQQGLAVMGIVAVSGIVATRRHRMVQKMINVVVGLIGLTVALVFLAGVVWLFNRHPSATSFSQRADWNPLSGGNIGLFGVITLGYLGVNIPMNMAGELAGNEGTRRKTITRHLLWGTLFVFTSYLLVTFAVLVVQGQNAANNLFAIVQTVKMAIGPIPGDIVTVCIMAILVVATITYNSAYARFLLVGGIDRRLPVSMGKLNKNRIPARAILVQTIGAIIITAILFMLVPYSGLFGGQPANVALEAYFVVVATATMIWAFSTVFLFVDLLKLYSRDPRLFRAHRLMPMPVLLSCSVLGFLTGLAAMVDTLFNSYIPPLIPNTQWLFITGGFTLVILVAGAIISMLATSEAAYQTLIGE